MNIAKSLKKLASNQTFVVLAAIVAVAAVYYYSQGFNTSLSSMAGAGEAAKAVDEYLMGASILPSKDVSVTAASLA